jgi:hypothetical protein
MPGHALRSVFEESKEAFSVLVLGRAHCADLLRQVNALWLFTGIMTEHAPDLSPPETGRLLQGQSADPNQAGLVRKATGGHPEWTALVVPQVRAGELAGLDRVPVGVDVH